MKSAVKYVTLQMFFINQALSLGARLYVLHDPDLSITSLRWCKAVCVAGSRLEYYVTALVQGCICCRIQTWVSRRCVGARLYLLQDPDLSITSLRRRNSTGVFVGSYLPHLICMDDDILSTGVKLYHLKVYSCFFIYLFIYSIYQCCNIYTLHMLCLTTDWLVSQSA